MHALERNEFEVLDAPVFAKGYLRKYAQLVRVDEKDVMADYYQLTRAAAMPPLVATRRRARREMSPGPWIAVIVAIILVATAYWWFSSSSTTTESPPPDDTAQEAVPISEAAAPGLRADDEATGEATGEVPDEVASGVAQADRSGQQLEDELDDSAILQSASTDAAEAAAQSQQVPALDDGQMRMLLTYSGDCWTEISDARGRRLFFDLGKDGRTVELSGEAPFNVLFGNVDNVRIRVNGVDRPVSAAERRGRTARLTIAGS